MQHTYLRYECADSFGLISSSASSKAPQSNSILAFGSDASRENPILLTTAGSHCMGYHLRTTNPTIKIAQREQLSGGVGTGRALNSDQVVCIDVAPSFVGTNVLGAAVGTPVGALVGATLGASVGAVLVGTPVGKLVGCAICARHAGG